MKLKVFPKDPHEILGVSKDADPNKIRKAYYKLARENHPDKFPEEEKENATKNFQVIGEAYEFLTNPKNKTYDFSNSQPKQPPPPPKRPKIEVFGKVVSVTNNNSFKIYVEKTGKRYKCMVNGFFPIQKGDALIGICEMTGDVLSFLSTPFAILGMDRDTVIDFFNKVLRNTKKSSQVLTKLLERTGDLPSAVNMMDRLSVFHKYSEDVDISDLNIGDQDISKPFCLIIPPKNFYKLLSVWYKGRVLRNLYLLELTNKEIRNSKLNPLILYQRCLDNPYSVVSIPLEKCDRILARSGRHVDKKFRECGKIIRKVAEMMDNNGWTGIPNSVILKTFPNLSEYLEMLKDEFGAVMDLDTLYLAYPYEVETETAEWIKTLLKSRKIYIPGEIKYTRNDLSEGQKQAIETSLNENISIITGPGGAGKTTVIKEIVHNLERNGIPYRIASFTGKAVARIREITGKKEPATLHMMIAKSKMYKFGDTPNSVRSPGTNYKRDKFKHLILDEASMITTELLFEFRKCFDHDFKITLVGDVKQLQPIGWGSLFDSLIKTQIIPTVVLNVIHRTSDNSNNGILINSKKIFENNGDFEYTLTSNFQIMQGDVKTVQSLVEILINKGFDPNKIGIISPYNRDLDVLNQNCSYLFNGVNRSTVDDRGKKWRIGDRVISTQNNYGFDIMNGDSGKVIDVDNKMVKIKYKDNTHVYSTGPVSEDEEGEKELNTQQLCNSFACSVHRYQGSEIDFVIGYIPEGNTNFLNKNLLYTLISRAKKMIWLVGDIETMERAALTKAPYRCENLAMRILM